MPNTKKYDDSTQYLMNIYTFTSHHPHTVFAYGETLQIVRSAEKDSKKDGKVHFFFSGKMILNYSSNRKVD